MLDENQISRLRSKGLTINDKNKLRNIIGKLGELGNGPCSPLATEAILSIITAHSDKCVKKFALDILKLMLEGKL